MEGLDELGPDAADEALRAVERGCAAGLLVERGPGGRPTLAHALVAETLQDGVSAARRARVHARIADALERRPEPRPAEVAHHLEVDRLVQLALERHQQTRSYEF